MTPALLAEQLAAELLSCGVVPEASLEEEGGGTLRGLQGQAVGQETHRTELQRD